MRKGRNNKYLIIGAGGHCRSVIDCLSSSGKEIAGILDLDFSGISENIMNVPVLGSYMEIVDKYERDRFSVVLAIGDNKKRKEIYTQLVGQRYQLPPVVHKSAIVSKQAVIDNGCFIGPGCIINAMASIGENSIVNTGAIIDHETFIGPHCHIGPGVRVAGRAQIGTGSFLGIGSSVINNIIIGSNVTVGAGSVIIEDVASNCTVVGVPGEKVK